MTTPAEPTVDNAADDGTPQGPAAEAPDPAAQPEPEPTPNSEAARYRVQLREAQSERDALAERLTGYQRQECESVVAEILDVPGDLWDIGGADIATFYNDDGSVNEAELLGAAAALVEMRPRLGKPKPAPNQWGQSGDTPPPAQAGWDAVI